MLKFTIAIPLVLPSPLFPHDSLSLHHLHIQGGRLHTFPSLLQTFPSINSSEKVVEASSALYFWNYHTPIQIVAKPTEALDTALVYLSLENPALKPEVCWIITT